MTQMAQAMSKAMEPAGRNSYPAGKKAPELILDITRESYFSWHSLEDKNIRTLAYTKCMAEMPHAIRQDGP